LLLLQVGVSVTAAAVNRGNQQLLAIRRFAAQVGTNCCYFLELMHVACQQELPVLSRYCVAVVTACVIRAWQMGMTTTGYFYRSSKGYLPATPQQL
jgi:hypothetical protein